jgi:BSD domain
MWNALRSDLKEFVSTVTEDTSQVLSKIDDSFPVLNSAAERGLSPEEQEALRRMRLDETYTSPLVVRDDIDDGGAAADEEERLAAQRAVLDAFVASFEVTDDLTKDLDDNPDLRDAYDRLVPDAVSERDFWMRYAYRCDADRIAAEWDSDDDDDDDEEEEEHQKDRSGAAVAQSLSSVTQFLGGAVKSVAASLKEADVQGGGGGGDDLVAGDVTTTAAGFFGVGGARPPFVMNTAVDEDDDDDAEEELGWDDDEEEDDDRVGDDDAQHQDSTQEEIEFRDAATEQLQEQLKQALEERDQLHETVSMQAKKIVDLMEQVSEGGSEAAERSEVEALKMKLFEAESELAAVKEGLVASPSFEEPSTPKNEEESSSGAAPDAELQRRTEELLAKLNETEGLCASLRDRVSELEGVCAELQNEKEEFVEKVASLQTVIETMEQDKPRAEAQALEVAERQDGLARGLQAKLDVAERRILELEQGLAEASRSANAASPETHESSASGVKVDAPASMEHLGDGAAPLATRATEPPAAAPTPPPVVEKVEGGEEGSDWGDEW